MVVVGGEGVCGCGAAGGVRAPLLRRAERAEREAGEWPSAAAAIQLQAGGELLILLLHDSCRF